VKVKGWGALVALTLGLFTMLGAGCRSSPPKHFYVLDAIPGQSSKDAGSSGPQAPLQIASVNIPAALDRQEMVRESGPGSLQLSDVNRWGAPLADMTQNVLTRDLIQRLPSGKVLLPRAGAPAGAYEITVDILKFDADSKGNVVFDGGWSLFRLGSDTPIMNRHVTFEEHAMAGDYAGQARAMSELLGRLADDIAAQVH
jgi:uncharacterized lipoprotein YmbA